MSQTQDPRSNASTSTDVEMGNLTTPAVDTIHNAPVSSTTSDGVPQTTSAVSDETGHIAVPQSALTRQETVEAIGPSTDLPTPMLPTGDSAAYVGPVVIINLLLTSTGTRHPYKIDERYLNKRGVAAQGTDSKFDPFVISVYTLKELIWRDWREEWEPRPTSPSAIRLIHFGRLLDDKLQLKDCRFSDHAPNVVHMSVKPQDVIEDEENAKVSGKGSIHRGGDTGDSEAGCRCIIL